MRGFLVLFGLVAFVPLLHAAEPVPGIAALPLNGKKLDVADLVGRQRGFQHVAGIVGGIVDTDWFFVGAGVGGAVAATSGIGMLVREREPFAEVSGVSSARPILSGAPSTGFVARVAVGF